jgi:hypothetical protein
MSAIEFKHRYHDAILGLLWRQWTRLGVSGQVADGSRRYVLDPEALLLFSAWFCRYDQRLYDLIIDWLRKNGSFINIQRLKALAGKIHRHDRASLGFIIHQMSADGDRRWQKLAEDLLPKKVEAPLPMFLNLDRRQKDFWRTADAAALQYGFLRSPYQPTAKVSGFPADDCATLLLQLRGVFGLSARAETILALLNQDICKIQDIADISGFSWKSIQDVLLELSATPVVATRGEGKRGRYYFLKSPDKISALFEVKDVIFPDWRGVFDGLAVIWETASNPRLEGLSEQTFTGELKRVFEEQIGETLLVAGIDELKFLNAETIYDLPDLLAQI